MRYGLHVNSGAAVTDPAVLREVGQLAEELGYDSVLIGDHVIPPRQITTPFPLKLEHPPWHVYQEQDWPDCFATLGFLAACTTRMRLGTSVIILPYRHPAVAAKQVATLDRLSGGRIICGVGIGWLREEFQFLGVPFAERAAMSEEYIAVMKALWAGEQPRGAGRYVTIEQAVNFGPLPLQQPHPPLWVGGNSLAALRRAARWGDGWQPVYLPPPVIAQKLGQLRALTEEAGRDFRRVEVTTLAGAGVTPGEARAYQAAGVQVLYLLTTSDQPRELMAQMRQFAATLQVIQ